jgi:hypothetical protein
VFLWDKENISHIARHDVSQAEAEQVIENNPLDLERQLRKVKSAFFISARRQPAGCSSSW